MAFLRRPGSLKPKPPLRNDPPAGVVKQAPLRRHSEQPIPIHRDHSGKKPTDPSVAERQRRCRRTHNHNVTGAQFLRNPPMGIRPATVDENDRESRLKAESRWPKAIFEGAKREICFFRESAARKADPSTSLGVTMCGYLNSLRAGAPEPAAPNLSPFASFAFQQATLRKYLKRTLPKPGTHPSPPSSIHY